MNRDINSDFHLRMSSQTFYLRQLVLQQKSDLHNRHLGGHYQVPVPSQMRVGAALGSRTQVIGQR